MTMTLISVMLAWILCMPLVSSFSLHHRPALRTPAFIRTRISTITPTQLGAAPSSVTATRLQIGERVGRGSYGTVHLATLDAKEYICKRAWTEKDLADSGSSHTTADRCKHYFDVEQHCLQKMDRSSPHITTYVDTFQGDDGNSWMTFQILKDKNGKPALSLEDVLALDWAGQHDAISTSTNDYHHLIQLQEALGMASNATVADTLDLVLKSMLEAIVFCHSQGIVHRDLKPGNLLCHPSSQSLVLIDFGSAADMDPVQSSIWFGKKRIGMEDDRVAISPIYTAPEIFIRPDHAPFNFDVYSAALIACQLIFNFLDERTDAAFHQQIKDTNWDLDAWLSRELSSKVRPVGINEGLEYISSRPGLWGLLFRMLRRDPEMRLTSNQALEMFQGILAGTVDASEDGPFLESVLLAMDTCDVPAEENELDFVQPRALHYVASFRRSSSLGLVLAEADEDPVDLEGEKLTKWREATHDAQPGEVFIMDIVKGGQAEQLGVFEIGDELQLVGDLPVANGGFEKVVGMLQTQPVSSTYIKLQFDRSSARQSVPIEGMPSKMVRIVDEGACSGCGRRKANEDTFLLHDIHLERGDVLLAGIFDGHGGSAASRTAEQLMPSLFTAELTSGALTSRQALELAWKTTCETYRNGCDEMGECIADYNRMDGIILASTGSKDLVAGTTASVVSLMGHELTVLNCGDSRTLVISPEGEVSFVTKDHTPQIEMKRIQRGIDQGLDYSLPQCSLSRWWITCGDIQYAVARSLEGPDATSKGIVSDPDISSLRASPGILLIASDGLWEVCGNDEVAREVTRLRRDGLAANAAAKYLCSKAVEKGSSDNVSVVIIYLDE